MSGQSIARHTMESVSHTRMTAFRRCRRMHHLSYDLGIRPVKKSEALTFGDVFHKWLECWFATAKLNGAPSWVCPVAPLESRDDDEISELVPPGSALGLHLAMERGFRALQASNPYEAAKLRALCLAYHLRWRLQDWVVLAVEQEYTCQLEHPDTGEWSDTHHRTGKIDAIIAAVNNGVDVIEHKSSAGAKDPGDEYFTRLRTDPQPHNYWIGSKALGYDPQGVIYDVACKPLLEPYEATPEDKREMTIGWGCTNCGGGKDKKGSGIDCDDCGGAGWRPATTKSPSGEPRYKAHVRLQDETPGEYGLRCFQLLLKEPHRYFHRVRVVRLENEIKAHELSDWQNVEAMKRERELGEFPMNQDACWMFNRFCDYGPLCWEGADPADGALYTVRKRKPATPEQPDGELGADVG